MSKKKNSLALFEVIAKSREKRAKVDMDVPGWMQGQNPPPQAGATAGSTPPPPPQPAAIQRPAPAGYAAGERVFSTDGNRLRLSLSYPLSLGLCVGMVLLLALVFFLGRLSTGPKGAAAGAGLAEDPAGGRTVAGGGNSNSGGNSTDAAASRVPGKFYLVIQLMQGPLAEQESEARKIIAYCKEHGENATLEKFTKEGKQSYYVWSSTKFDSLKDDDNAVKFAKKIEEMGKKYFSDRRGKYRFGQPSADGEYYWIPAK